MNRRKFFRASAGATLAGFAIGCADGSSGGPAESSTAMKRDRSLANIGVQLYTVRTLMANDVPGTLRSISDIGYDEVEFHDYFGHPPAEVRKMLDDVGLSAPARHFSLQDSRERLDAIIDAAQTIGHDYLVIPYLSDTERSSLDLYRQWADHFNLVAESCKAANIQFAYHNHDFEFEAIDGVLPYDILLERTDPSLVDFEIDLFWITKGGQDPLEYFDKHPGRFSLCHVKDADAALNQVAVGQGVIDYATILGRSEDVGIAHFFVEEDNPEDPIKNATASYEYLRQLRFQ